MNSTPENTLTSNRNNSNSSAAPYESEHSYEDVVGPAIRYVSFISCNTVRFLEKVLPAPAAMDVKRDSSVALLK